MQINPIQRKSALSQSPDSIFDLYNSPELGGTLKSIASKINASQPQRELLITAVGDTILGFYQTKDLPNLLHKSLGVPPETAQRIVAELAEHLSPVLERERLLANPKLEEVKALHNQFAISAGQVASPVASGEVGTEPEEPLHNVTPMRTMAGDMTRIHGYGAYRQINPTAPADPETVTARPQEEILQARGTLTGVPKVGE